MLATPSATSTIVIVSASRPWWMWRGGAVSAVPTTPTTIADMATYS
jgi:hypothetical protein